MRLTRRRCCVYSPLIWPHSAQEFNLQASRGWAYDFRMQRRHFVLDPCRNTPVQNAQNVCKTSVPRPSRRIAALRSQRISEIRHDARGLFQHFSGRQSSRTVKGVNLALSLAI